MTESIPITYPSKATNEILKKKHKDKLLKDSPETLYSDLYRNGEVSNIIFHTEDPEAWHSAIRHHYPTVIRKGISNGWKLQIKEGEESDSDVMITANLYKNGTVMIQGKLKQFEKDFLLIKEKAQQNKISPKTQKIIPNTQKCAEEPSTSSHQSRDDSEEICLLHSIISDMKEKFREMELELVQLREEMHGAVKETDPTQKEADYRKEIEMLKKETQEMKKQGEEYSNQLSVMREEMRKLRESHIIERSAVEKQSTQRGDQQSLEETRETRSSRPPPADSYSPSQPHIVLLMDSNGKFIDERKKRQKNLVPKHREGPGALV